MRNKHIFKPPTIHCKCGGKYIHEHGDTYKCDSCSVELIIVRTTDTMSVCERLIHRFKQFLRRIRIIDSYETPDCVKCVYFDKCPVGYSHCNAACLTIYKNRFRS